MPKNLRRGRSGSTSVQLALALIPILGVGALVVDIGYARLVHVQLQGAVDAAAHAGVGYLDGTADGMDNARLGAVEVGAMNFVNGQPMTLDPDVDVALGFWDGVDFIESEDPDLVDAVFVDGTSQNLETWFARAAFGTKELATNADAIAVMPAPEPAGAIICYIPIAVPECLFDKYPDDEIIDVDLELQNDNNDTAGWALVGNDPASASNIRDHMDNCEEDGELVLSDTTQLNNGAVTSALKEMADQIVDSDTKFDEDTFGPIGDPYERSTVDQKGGFGNSYEGAIIVFDGGDDCDNVKYNQDASIVGFVWGSVYDVQATGPAADKNIALRLDTLHEFDVGTAGGGTLEDGIVYQAPPMLVR